MKIAAVSRPLTSSPIGLDTSAWSPIVARIRTPRRNATKNVTAMTVAKTRNGDGPA
jgi:hypothetical protein